MCILSLLLLSLCVKVNIDLMFRFIKAIFILYIIILHKIAFFPPTTSFLKQILPSVSNPESL